MKIAGFEQIISIDKFSCCMQVGEHETCRFSVSVTDKNLEGCARQLGGDCSIENDDFRFTGTITEITVTKGMYTNRLDAVVLGSTIKFDGKQKCRIFQDSEKRLSDILKYTEMSGVEYSALSDEAVEEILVQNHETDWQFVNRVASYLGKYVFPGEHMWIGDPIKDSVSINEEEITEMKLVLREKNSECICRIKKKLSLGQKVVIQGKTYFADAVRYINIKEEYVWEYHLTEWDNEPVYRELPACHLQARVQDNNDPDHMGRVKLEFLEPYEDVMKDRAVWIETGFQWASEKMGISCIPHKKDTVIVRISDKTARVQSSVRTEAYDDRYQDCDTRYFFVNDKIYGSVNEEKAVIENHKFRCELSEEKLMLKFGDKMEILIDEEGISSTMDRSRIKMEHNSILLNTDKTNIEIASETKIKTNGFFADGKSKAAITASKVDINGKGGVSIN